MANNSQAKRSIVLAILHYLGLIVSTAFVYVGMTLLLRGEQVMSIVVAVIFFVITEIICYKLRSLKTKQVQNQDSSIGIILLWTIYSLLALITTPFLAKAFSTTSLDNEKIHDVCSAEITSVRNLAFSLENLVRDENAFQERNRKPSGNPEVDAARDINIKKLPNAEDRISKNLYELDSILSNNILENTKNPFDMLFLFSNNVHAWETNRDKIYDSLNDTIPQIDKSGDLLLRDGKVLNISILDAINSINGEQDGDFAKDYHQAVNSKKAFTKMTSNFYSFSYVNWLRISSLLFVLLLNLLILWEIWNIRSAHSGQIKGGSGGIVW